MNAEIALTMSRLGMVLEFASFWLVAPEIIGADRLDELDKRLKQLHVRAKEITNDSRVAYGAVVLSVTFAFLLGMSLQNSPTAHALPIWPGNWDYLSEPPLPVLAAMTLIYSQFALALWYGSSRWWETVPREFRTVLRAAIIVGYAAFSFGLVYLIIYLMRTFGAASQWWLTSAIAGWGIACLVFWTLLTFGLKRWQPWIAALIVYDLGAWMLLSYVGEEAASFFGLVGAVGVLGLNAVIISPVVEQVVSLLQRKRDLRARLVIIGVTTYVVSFLLQFMATY